MSYSFSLSKMKGGTLLIGSLLQNVLEIHIFKVTHKRLFCEKITNNKKQNSSDSNDCNKQQREMCESLRV